MLKGTGAAPVRRCRKGAVSMLPCKQNCQAYHEGCHKSCAGWKERQARLRAERQAKKDYLRYYNELCGSVTRQLRGLGAFCGAR